MGDRGNIVVIQNKSDEHVDQIWLYTHWGGSCLAENLREALLAYRGRWTDCGYLTRGILMKMIPAEYRDQETSGIYTQLTDNEHDILVCDVPDQRVFTMKESDLVKFRIPPKFTPKKSFSFHDFSQKLPKLQTA